MSDSLKDYTHAAEGDNAMQREFIKADELVGRLDGHLRWRAIQVQITQSKSSRWHLEPVGAVRGSGTQKSFPQTFDSFRVRTEVVCNIRKVYIWQN